MHYGEQPEVWVRVPAGTRVVVTTEEQASDAGSMADDLRTIRRILEEHEETAQRASAAWRALSGADRFTTQEVERGLLNQVAPCPRTG